MTSLPRLSFVTKRLRNLLQSASSYITKFRMEATTDEDYFRPPEAVRGMKDLDREAFTKEVQVNMALVPILFMNKFQKVFKKDILRIRGAKVLETSDSLSDGLKLVAFKPHFNFEDLDEEKSSFIQTSKIEPKLYQKRLQIRYGNYKHHEILGAILPEGQDATSGFERVGHIAHLNLREHQLPYKNIIGQVLIDTHKILKTVVHKSSTIDNTFRNFEMEVIAGEEDFIATVTEHGRTFQFDFSKVFWNSKLQTEHNRLYELIPEHSAVFDACAGVGPFSIPLAKKGCRVYANDLNGESYKWLLTNAKLNKAQLNAFNIDARQFIRECLGKYLRSEDFNGNIPVYVIMNLPAIAITFLDAFRGLLGGTNLENGRNASNIAPSVSVFCYVFSSAEDKLGDVRIRASQSLGSPLPNEHDIREIRSVSPGTDMFCLAFRIPEDVLRDGNECEEAIKADRTEAIPTQADCTEPVPKRLKSS